MTFNSLERHSNSLGRKFKATTPVVIMLPGLVFPLRIEIGAVKPGYWAIRCSVGRDTPKLELDWGHRCGAVKDGYTG
jgi:hypothetical protein